MACASSSKMNDTNTLKEKALWCAINDIMRAENRSQANERFMKWKVFHSDYKFKETVKKKQEQFKTK